VKLLSIKKEAFVKPRPLPAFNNNTHFKAVLYCEKNGMVLKCEPCYEKKGMKKSELIEALRVETKLTKNKSEEVVELFFAEISHALARGEKIEIRGFCSLFTKNYKSYIGKNPKTGETVLVSAKKMPVFRSGKELKKRVDYPETQSLVSE
jgi:integration host factor subunit beta